PGSVRGLLRPYRRGVAVDHRPQPVSQRSGAGSEPSRGYVPEGCTGREGRESASGRHPGPRDRSRRRQAALSRLPGGNRPVEVDECVDREEVGHTRDGAELEYGAEAGGLKPAGQTPLDETEKRPETTAASEQQIRTCV